LKKIRTVVRDVLDDRIKNLMIFGLDEEDGGHLH
jgi:hypothetical protein